MNRSLKLSMLVALALGSGHAMAVSLGQAQVKSSLGQPLLVEVPLNPASPAELRNLTVRLASNDAYARAGITDGRTSVPLHFAVVNRGGGKAIRITSTAPIGNPYLDLLLEVNGGGGKSVREVAILLDPPGMSSPASAAPPVAAPAPRPAMRQPPVVAKTPPSSARSTAPAAVSNGKFGPVERGQTLTGIARETLPTGVDLNQMMLAYKQANPDAFYQDNVNALKSGAVLRVPSAADARAMATAAALAEVRRQNSDWRAGATSKPVALADAGTRPASKSPGSAPSDQADRLALVPAKNGDKGKPSGSAGSKGQSANDLRQELLRTKESVASLQQQGVDLNTRLEDLHDINEKNKSLLTLKDSQIADLQRKLAAAREAAHLPPATSTVANAQSGMPAGEMAEAGSPMSAMTPASATSAATSAASATVAASSTVAGLSAMPAATSVAASRAASVTPASPPLSKPAPLPMVVEQPWYMQPWAWAAAAGVVVVLLLLALLGRRKSVKTPASADSSLADRFGAGAPPPLTEPDDEPMLTDEDLDQDELLDQLAEHPDDVHLHLELVTLYYSRRDVEHFEAAAEAMYAHVTDPQQDEWQDVVHMGEDLTPQHPLFLQRDEGMVSETEATPTFDIDDYAADEDAADDYADDEHAAEGGVAIPPLSENRPVSEYNYDFDLTARHPETLPEATEAPTVDAGAYDDDMVAEPEPMIASDAASEEVSTSDVPAADVESNFDSDEFNDDPIDTKLDLARAYLDMGDADGARAMLEEVLTEGSQMQQETAKGLLDNMA